MDSAYDSPGDDSLFKDKILVLMHLRKLLSDFSRSNISPTDYDQKLAKMVPLYCKLATVFTPAEIKDQFKEAPAFAGHLTKIFVQEIRKRATHQNTETAASSIALFLQREGPPETFCAKLGSQLLFALSHLVRTGSRQVIEAICHASLPSTMVKSLYLFYDLPKTSSSDDKDTFVNRNVLYDTVIEIMSSLVCHACAAEELTKKDDLALLFSGVSSWCPEHNQRWRRATAQLLMILSSRCTSQSVINYVHSKSCVSLFVQNLRRGKDLSVVEVAEMVVCLFCVLKDSSTKTKLLFEDLKEVNGYSFLTDFILINESDARQDVQDALRNLILMFNTVVNAGTVDIKPAPLTSVLYSLPGFSLPQPLGQGFSVRNIFAFQVLESVFLKSRQSAICSTVLDVVSSIYSADPANYFILEPRCVLGQFGEIICNKSQEVQAKFFEILEYVVFHLNYIPSKELLAVCISLKTAQISDCTILCLHSFFKMLGYSSVFRDVFREVGLIEVLVAWLQSYWTDLRTDKAFSDLEKTTYILTLDMLSTLIKQNNQNAGVFRDSGGSRMTFALVNFLECRNNCIMLIQQMLMMPGGEDELASLCTLLHSSNQEDLSLKIQILRCLVQVLRESHRVRIAFRRAGGYLYVVSLLVNMEGAFKNLKLSDADTRFIDHLEQLQLIFKVLTLSMRFEPANAKFFASEVRFNSLTEGLRLLGCFKTDELALKATNYNTDKFQYLNKVLSTPLNSIFSWKLEERAKFPDEQVPDQLALICFVVRILYDMALDNYEKPNYVVRKSEPALVDAPTNGRFLNPPSNCDSIVVHPGAVICLMELLPSIAHIENEMMLSGQLFVAEILKSLVRSERNQQVMCDAGLPRTLFAIASAVLILDDHPLLAPFHYILERLSAHSMQPKELRQFLRLGNPLCCISIDDSTSDNPQLELVGGPIPLSRVKTLVSMMTPRDFRITGANSTPSFVEFDMSIEGFGCIFLPSIAPQASSETGGSLTSGLPAMGSLPAPLGAVLTPVGGLMQGLGESVSSPTSALMGSSSSSACSSGGLGFGERIFPPLTGLTFAAWIYIDRFSDLGADSHPIRLLTIVRVIQKTSKGHSPSDYPSDLVEQACFQIQVMLTAVLDSLLHQDSGISPVDHALLIATHESDTPGADLDRDVNGNDTFARVSIAEFRQEQQWCHCAVVLTRSMLKNSSVSVYVNGRHRVTQKIHYISQNSAINASTSLGQQQTVTVKAIIGTAPGPFRKQSKLLWRTGSTYLIEEACSNQAVHQIYKLGSNYIGSFQAPVLPSSERLQPLIQEEKIVFGLNARAVSQMTLARLRKVYNKADGKSIARTLGISSHENATPIRILHNSSAHLSGPSRSLGGVLIGYLGIRTFCPKPVAKLLESVGGSVTLLGLVGMATDTEGLYAAIKALLCALKWNKSIAMEMDACRGYQTLAMLLKEKSHLLHSHVLHLIFSLIGTLDASHETASIPNVQAFEDLLCDLLAWRRASPDLQRLLYEHFYLLITESGDQKNNLRIIRHIGLLGRILQITAADPKLLWTTKEIIFNLIAAILQPPCDNVSLLRFGQFIASTLPTACPADAEKKLPFDVRDLQSRLFSSECRTDDVNQLMLYQVYVRNRCLNILLNILLHTSGQLNVQVCEQVAKVLGFDWILALLSSRSHSATVWAALKILLALTGHQTLMQKFKEGVGNGGWLKEAECVVQNRAGVVLGFSVSARCGTVGSACDLNPEICTMPGFLALQHVLPYHATLPDPFLALLSQLVGQPAKDLPHVHEFDLDGIWSLIFGLPPNHSVADAISKVELCPEASLPLLSLIRRCVTLNVEAVWCKQYPVTLIQFLTFLYHNVIEFSTYATSEEFLTTLTATLFKDSEGDEMRAKSDALPDHPAVKYIIDLLRNIIVDSFAFAPVTKGDTIIDMMLEIIPEGSSRSEQSAFITHLLRSVMDHLVAADVLLCGQSLSLPLTLSVTSNYSVLAANVFYFTARTVDCVWNSLYVRDAQVVLDFILKLFNQVKRKGGNNVLADPLYFPLNRCTLFVLSRFIDGVNGQLSLLESLNKVIAARSIIFSQVNVDQEFFGCLCHLLFMLTDISNQELPLNVDNRKKDQKVIDEENRIREGALLIANSARRLWEELFLSKKSIVEEIFHVGLVPEINAARALVGELANRCWHNTVDGETRGVVSKDAFQIHLQLQSKLQKVAGGLQRLANRKAARPTSIAKNMPVSAQTLELWMKVHISLIRELVELMYTQYLQWHEHTEKWCLDEWRNLEQELTRERGLWGPFNDTKLSKWQLDSTEGPNRMRKKLIPNLSFYVNYPYRPSLDLPENKNLRCKVAISHDSKLFYERMKSTRERTMDQRIIDTSNLATNTFEDRPIIPLRDVLEINTNMIRKASRQLASSDLQVKSRSLRDDDLDDQSMSIDEETTTNPRNASESASSEKGLESVRTELNATVDKKNVQSSMINQQSQGETGGAASTLRGPDNQTLLRLLEEGEELQSMFRCARINGLETSEGLLLFGKQHYYVVDGFTLLKTKEIRDLDFLSEDLHDPIVPYIANGPQRQVGVKRLCSKFPYEDIREVHKRRYLLQPIALEVFSNDGRNYLLAFPKRVRNKVYSKFLAVARSLIDTADQSVSGQRTSVNLEAGASLFGALMGEMSVTQRWARGELTNFQYLMHLNTLAGRSYNDLSQYPIFPWILSDYDSEELDLTDAASFRDLSKPMGAQTPERLEQFMKRYREWDDPSGETLPYMYGTHYSSAMIVVSYLARLEPFTQQFLKLQGGHFDLADRMFHSVREGWYSASKNNMADVKELIPEFFYLPEFLLNSNRFDLGIKQSGVQLNDAILPKWARNDPREFIRLHREALESDFVSLHLNEWIDLIFGYKQQGQSAVESCNLFHHLFYEGNVDFESIEDPLTRNATIGFINNFGQIPTQLFKKPHPQKKIRVLDSSLPTQGVTTEKLFFHCMEHLKPPMMTAKELRGPVGCITQNDKGNLCCVEQNKVLMPPNNSKYFSWGYADNSVRMGNLENEKSLCVYEMTGCGEIVCASCPNSRTIITGSTSTVVVVWEIIPNPIKATSLTFKFRKALYGHTEQISCVYASANYGILISGSRDATCIVWDLSNLQFIRQLRPDQGPISAVCINEATGDIAVACSTYLFIYSINGTLLASVNTASSPKVDGKQTILCIAFSALNEWDPQHVILTGSNDGVVRMWSLDFVQVPADAEAPDVNGTSGSRKDSPLVKRAPTQMSNVSTAAGDLVPMVDPLKSLDDEFYEGCPDSKLPPTDKEIDVEDLRRRLADENLTGGSDDERPRSSTDGDRPTPKFCVGSVPNSSVGPDSGLGTPHARIDSEIKEPLPKDCCYDGSVSPPTPTFESRFTDLSNLINNESSSSCTISARSEQLAKRDSSDSFVLLNKDGLTTVKTPNKLRNGFKWRRQLVFRYKLTMYTSFERKDNNAPAAVTALAVSKDHKSVFVGDSRGRVWTWTIGESNTGGRADHWFQDPSRNSCALCHQKFSLTERRHHCRNCGQIFCSRCSRYESDIRHLKITKPVRVCQNCYIRLKVLEAGNGP